MKDRNGNEWVLVPLLATDDMIKAFRETAITTNKGSIVGVQSAIAAAIAAAPQFAPAEVTDDMIERAFQRAAWDFADGSTRVTYKLLQAWRAELGPTLGMVQLREPAEDECERIDAEFHRLLNRDETSLGRDIFTAVSKWLKGEL